jgi:nucleoside-diphosphate-sugar epimerase
VILGFAATLADGASSVVYGHCEQTHDFDFVDDIVAANLLAAAVT